MAWIWKPTAIQVLTLMVFWGQIQNYMMRINLSMLIVAMVKDGTSNNSTATTQETLHSSKCLQNDSHKPTEPHQIASNPDKLLGEQFDWSPFTQGIVLAAFSYGYVTTQIIGGRLTEKFGIRKIYGGCLFMTGVITFILLAVRVIRIIRVVIMLVRIMVV